MNNSEIDQQNNEISTSDNYTTIDNNTKIKENIKDQKNSTNKDNVSDIKVDLPKTEDQENDLYEEEINLQNLNIEDIIKVNMSSISFGEVYPGQILEETIIILNILEKKKISIKIKINCLEKEFDDLDEYVYSMRRPSPQDIFNYNDLFVVLLAEKAISYYKLAIKVPSKYQSTTIRGNVVISLQNNDSQSITIPVTSKIIIPKLKCEKLINVSKTSDKVLKLYMKNTKRQDFRISMKNCSSINFTVEPSVLRSETLNSKFEFNFFPTQLVINSNSAINFAMSVKSMDIVNDYRNKEIKVVIVLKIKGVSIFYAYPVIILIGDGKTMEGPN